MQVAIEFDKTLDTVGPVEWNDAEEGVMSTVKLLRSSSASPKTTN